MRPPQPKYTSLWEVKRVLMFLHQSGDNTKLSLMKELTLKLAMFLALVLARPSSDLVRLSVQGVHEFPQAISILLTGLAKQSRPGQADRNSVIGASFSGDPYLCPVVCFKEYVARTAALWIHNIYLVIRESGFDFRYTPLEAHLLQKQQRLEFQQR